MTRHVISLLGMGLLALSAAACARNETSSERARPAGSSEPSPANGRRLLEAELRRDPSLIGEAELTAVDAKRREASVRALARIQDERSFDALAKALSDEQPAVVAWAAFGVGALCRAREAEAVRRLALRAATLNGDPAPPDRDQALAAIALALGRCGSEEAERTLRSWLRQPAGLSRAAALGLGRVARKRKQLDDASIAALLDTAAAQPQGAYFHPLETLPALGNAARERLLEVAKPVLDRPAPARAFALRALSKAGPEAAAPLRSLIEAPDSSDPERADAARSLASLGNAGQIELGRVLTGRARALIDGGAWLTSQHGVLLTVLDALEPARAEREVLAELAQLPLNDEPASVVRRKVMLRCRAAALLAVRDSRDPTLLACDPAAPAERREGALAQLRVLNRGPLNRNRAALFHELVRSSDRVVREAALELLASHDELTDIPELLASALGAKEAGVRATAAKVLARYPARARPPGADDAPAKPLDARVVQALTSQLAQIADSSDIELSSLLLDAAVALELLGAKPALERACASANPTLRQHAERGLAALGEATRRCGNVPSQQSLGRPASSDVRLEFDTDIGTLALTLSGRESPLAVERIVELARSGFYDDMLVHRVVPGFVVQFGDPDGDGFGGADLPPLRCELGPQPFEPGSVGVALAGRDTGSSQLFVTLCRAPHLDGEYSRIGQAEPGWDRLAQGDRILKVRLLEAGAGRAGAGD